MTVDYLEFFPDWVRDAAEPRGETEWWSWRGMRIRLERAIAPAAPVKYVVLHGAGGHAEMLWPYVRLLGAVDAVAPDLPGYGLTRCNGRPVTYELWVDLAAELVRLERERDDRPVVVLGASMGGMLAYSAVARAGADGLVATCLLDMRDAEVRAAAARFGWLGRHSGSLLSGFRVLDGMRVPVRWPARMSAMANRRDLNAAVAGDRFGGGGRVSLRFLRTYMTSVPEVEPDEFTACPVLVVHPGADGWTPVELSRPFFDRLPVERRLVMLDGCGHMPVEDPGLGQMADALRAFNAELTSSVDGGDLTHDRARGQV
ncbi:alpha/beta hydrolase [Actinomadura algeriensis]|uniref:Alpha-beta hydrolase superfamily lysophospholipase n=1 Tax=Actinomadura algeriensis TaxID=1679523 RepID=A0ABR9JZ32_9ACTN|nr:alpha/beta hydrolase [Actinomadura algeriensis]MBE1535839.1 alpha-beta hydrolase superfamily lysophospholipase [Actinomadura algeriensis]